MPAQYIAKVILKFSAAHKIIGHTGGCQNLHGHNWSVEVEACAHELDELGISVDFSVIKTIARKYTDKWDHTYLNEIPPFDKINPTSENLSKWLYKEIEGQLNTSNIKLVAVTVWETETCSVRFSQN